MATSAARMTPPPSRPLSVAPQTSAPRPVGRLATLRVPLAVKVVGANALGLLILASAWLYLDAGVNHKMILGLFLFLLAMHLVMVLVALRPVRDLEDLAARVWNGDYAARFHDSSVADAEVLRVGTMFNTLLDGLAADRARMRLLAEEVVAIGDRERATLARELHDSTAQRLAALVLQISSVARDARDSDLTTRLGELRDAAEALTEDVRLLASSVHPRVLDDLGLIAAVRKLARDCTRASKIDVKITGPDSLDLPQAIAAVLYRVAQEAVRNAAAHSGARSVRIAVQRGDGIVSIEIADDGAGFDVADALRRRPGMGLFTMRERVSLVDGTFEIRSDTSGTTVAATVPLTGIVTMRSVNDR
jgi:signal transduction histidine kinase